MKGRKKGDLAHVLRIINVRMEDWLEPDSPTALHGDCGEEKVQKEESGESLVVKHSLVVVVDVRDAPDILQVKAHPY